MQKYDFKTEINCNCIEYLKNKSMCIGIAPKERKRCMHTMSQSTQTAKYKHYFRCNKGHIIWLPVYQLVKLLVIASLLNMFL